MEYSEYMYYNKWEYNLINLQETEGDRINSGIKQMQKIASLIFKWDKSLYFHQWNDNKFHSKEFSVPSSSRGTVDFLCRQFDEELEFR